MTEKIRNDNVPCMESVRAWHIYSGGDSLFLLKNDRTVFTLISSRCDISFAEQPLADKVSI